MNQDTGHLISQRNQWQDLVVASGEDDKRQIALAQVEHYTRLLKEAEKAPQ